VPAPFMRSTRKSSPGESVMPGFPFGPIRPNTRAGLPLTARGSGAGSQAKLRGAGFGHRSSPRVRQEGNRAGHGDAGRKDLPAGQERGLFIHSHLQLTRFDHFQRLAMNIDTSRTDATNSRPNMFHYQVRIHPDLAGRLGVRALSLPRRGPFPCAGLSSPADRASGVRPPARAASTPSTYPTTNPRSSCS
jgi:hypothetical protein